MGNPMMKASWLALWQVLKMFFRAQPYKLVIGMLMASMTIFFGVALLGLSGWFITATAVAGSISTLAALSFNVLIPSAIIRFLALARTGARYGERLVTHDATLTVLADLRERLFRGYAQSQAAQSLLKRPAQLLFRLTVDIDALDALYLRILVPAASALIVTIIMGIAFGAWLSPWLGVALVIWLLLVGLGVPLLMSFKAQRVARLKAYACEALRARAVDLVAGQVEMLMAGQMDRQFHAIMKADAYLSRADNDMNKLELCITIAHGLAMTLALIGALLICAVMVQSAVLGAPMAAFALLVVLAIFEPFTALRRGAVEFGRTMLAVKRLAPRLDVNALPFEVSAPQSQTALSNDMVLEVKDVSFAYSDTTRQVLQNVSLRMKRGQRVAVVGSSGSGKSTLLALIAQEMQPDSGKIICPSFSMLTQRTELFKDTLRGNLLLANPQASDEMLWQALEDAGLASTIKQFPQGLDTWLGEGGQGLSGGQARRLTLARLLLRSAPLWLLDEPTEGLDQKTAQDVLERINTKVEHQAMLIATHLQREAKLANCMIVFDKNQIMRFYSSGEQGYQYALGQLKPN